MTLTERTRKLNTYIAPSGNERGMLEYVKSEIENFTDETYFDAMGNLITVMGKGKGEKVMFSSHSDTIGFISYFIDDKGFIRVNNLGGLNLRTITGRKVCFVNGVQGVLFYETDNNEQVIKNYFVDIGTSSKVESEKLVPIGTAGSIVSDVYLIGLPENQRIVSAFLDDRIAVAIQMELMERIYNEKIELKNEFYMVFSVQEEVGIRGAKTAAYSIDPIYAIALDVTSVSDIPKSGNLSMKLDGGACIKLMDSSVYCHKNIVEFLRTTAEENNIKYQYEILTAGGTDAGAIHVSRQGVYTGAISIPTRYIHSPVETASLNDCKNIVELLIETVRRGYIL